MDRPPTGPAAGRQPHDQRCFDAGVVERALGTRHRDSVVGRRDDQRVARQAQLLQPFKQSPDLPVDDRIHGQSLLPLLDGLPSTSREEIFSELTYHDYYDPRRAIRTETHKLIVNFSAAPSLMDPTQSWQPRSRPVVPVNPATAFHQLVELYDLTVDPHELTNLANDPAQAAIRADLLNRLHAWMTETADPLLAGPVVSPSHERAIQAMLDT